MAGTSVEVDPSGALREELHCQVDVHLDHPPRMELVAHADEGPDLVEQPARRMREVAAVVGQALDRALAGIQHRLLVAASPGVIGLLDDTRGQLPVDGAAEVVHPSTPLVVLTASPAATPCSGLVLGTRRNTSQMALRQTSVSPIGRKPGAAQA